MNVPRWIRELEACAQRDLPRAVAAALAAAGANATEPLLGLLQDPAHGSDRVAAHAVEVLGLLDDPEAVPHLVELLHERDGDLDMYAHDA